ncbi:MAG: CAP domain-containing protein [Ruminococcaceae bacterium]|nr:CAP domain-containing protein [Oscillospiraceae bacterium]
MSSSDKLFQDGIVYEAGNTLESNDPNAVSFADRLINDTVLPPPPPVQTVQPVPSMQYTQEQQIQQLHQWLSESPETALPAVKPKAKKNNRVGVIIGTAAAVISLGVGGFALGRISEPKDVVQQPESAIVDTVPSDDAEGGAEQVVLPDSQAIEPAETTAATETTTTTAETTTTAAETTTAASEHTVVLTPPTSAIPTAPSGANYKVVHIEGITLPASYGDGYLNPDAALWVVNQLRAMYGKPPLEKGDEKLEKVAKLRLDEVMRSFKTTRDDGRKFSSALTEAGIDYSYCCESAAYGQYTAEHVVSDWMQSKKSRENIYDERIKYVSITCMLDDEGVPLWVFEAIAPPEETAAE